MVCREWLSSSRYHLFESVELRRNNGPKFMELLDSPFVTFTHSVRRIVVDLEEDDIFLDNLMSVFPSFNSLKSLALSNIPSLDTNPDRDQILATLAKVTELEITRIIIRPPELIIQFISRFTSLEKLSIRMCDVFLMPQYHLYPSPSRLRSLSCRFDFGVEDHMFGWFCAQVPPFLEELDVTHVNTANLPSVGRLVKSIGPNLRSLSITLDAAVTPGRLLPFTVYSIY